MKNIDKIFSVHAIVESLTAEAMEYDMLLNDYAMMAEEGDAKRSAWEKTWRDEFEHHVSALNTVTHLLEEFLKCEDSIDESGDNSEEVVDSSEKELPEFSKQDRCSAIKIAEDFVSELEEAYLRCGGDDDSFIKDTAIVVSNLLSLLKGEGIIENSFLYRGYHGYYGKNGQQVPDMEVFLTGFDIGADGLVVFPDATSANVHVVHCVHRSDDTDGFDNLSPEELVYSLCPETYDLLISSEEFEDCYEDCYLYLKCDDPSLSEKFLDTVPKPVRADERIVIFRVAEDDFGWSQQTEESYLVYSKGETLFAPFEEYQRFMKCEKTSCYMNIKAYSFNNLEALFKKRLTDGRRGDRHLPRVNISSDFSAVLDNATCFGFHLPCSKNLNFIGFLDGNMKFIKILKEKECESN